MHGQHTQHGCIQSCRTTTDRWTDDDEVGELGRKVPSLAIKFASKKLTQDCHVMSCHLRMELRSRSVKVHLTPTDGDQERSIAACGKLAIISEREEFTWISHSLKIVFSSATLMSFKVAEKWTRIWLIILMFTRVVNSLWRWPDHHPR